MGGGGGGGALAVGPNIEAWSAAWPRRSHNCMCGWSAPLQSFKSLRNPAHPREVRLRGSGSEEHFAPLSSPILSYLSIIYYIFIIDSYYLPYLNTWHSLSARWHFRGPKKLSNSRARHPPTSSRNGFDCTHPKHYARGYINHRCKNSY